MKKDSEISIEEFEQRLRRMSEEEVVQECQRIVRELEQTLEQIERIECFDNVFDLQGNKIDPDSVH